MNNQTIPQIIHSVWVGGGEKSDIIKKCRESWSKYCPEYTIIEWNETNFDIQNTCDYVLQAYKSKKWAFVSDYIRLRVLYEYGGVYLDTDSELLSSLNPFLNDKGFVCIESRYTLSLGIIGVIPKSEWIKDLIKEYEVTPFFNKSGEMNLLPINKRVQKLFEKRYQYHWSNSIQRFYDGVVVYPSEYFSPINPYTGVKSVTNKTVMIHHYDNTWMSLSDKRKRKIKQMITRIMGEDLRAKIARLKN